MENNNESAIVVKPNGMTLGWNIVGLIAVAFLGLFLAKELGPLMTKTASCEKDIEAVTSKLDRLESTQQSLLLEVNTNTLKVGTLREFVGEGLQLRVEQLCNDAAQAALDQHREEGK